MGFLQVLPWFSPTFVYICWNNFYYTLLVRAKSILAQNGLKLDTIRYYEGEKFFETVETTKYCYNIAMEDYLWYLYETKNYRLRNQKIIEWE